MSEPTKAAIAAANELNAETCTQDYGEAVRIVRRYAEVIDRETGLPELIAALREAHAKLSTVTMLDIELGTVPLWPKTMAMIEDALRKAGEL